MQISVKYSHDPITVKNTKQINKGNQESRGPPVSLSQTSKECITAWLLPAPETLQNWGLDIRLPTQPSPSTRLHPCIPLLPVLMYFWEAFDLMSFATQECVLKLLWILNLLLRLNNKLPTNFSSVYFKLIALQVCMDCLRHAVVVNMFSLRQYFYIF